MLALVPLMHAIYQRMKYDLVGKCRPLAEQILVDEFNKVVGRQQYKFMAHHQWKAIKDECGCKIVDDCIVSI